MANNAVIEKICNDCDAGKLPSLPLLKLDEYKQTLESSSNPYPALPKWNKRIPDTLKTLNAIINEKQTQESRDSESLSISRSALCCSKWALIASGIAIVITVVPLIIKIISTTNPPVKKMHNQQVVETDLRIWTSG